MNKAQLLADLAARTEYISWVGTPLDVGAPEEDGSKLYRVKIRQISGVSGGFTNVDFYVFDEGGPGELAWYKDQPPQPRPRPSAIREWILGAITADPNSYKGFAIIWVSERYEMVVFSTLEGTPTLATKYWYVRKGQGAKVEINSATPAAIQNLITALKGSLLQV